MKTSNPQEPNTKDTKCKTCNKPLITNWHEGDCIKCARDKVLKDTSEWEKEYTKYMADCWDDHIHKYPEADTRQWNSGFDMAQEYAEGFLALKISQAKEEGRKEGYEQGLDDMFMKICDLAEPDERQPSAGDLHTNMDDIHEIRKHLLAIKKD